MFSGIVTDIGIISEVEGKEEKRFILACSYAPKSIRAGDSIACDGVCLTATTDAVPHAKGSTFTVIASPETLRCTTLSHWQLGTAVNLERALTMQDALSGHLVAGHVDGLTMLTEIVALQDCHALTFTLPAEFKPFIAAKGSVCLNGVSLTVNTVMADMFTVMIIPHTWQYTTFHLLQEGQEVHIEIDLIARYVGRYLEATKGIA